MTVVVSDTGPLNYLIQCESADVLGRLYERMVIPTAVQTELLHPAAPPAVRNWLEKLPAWAEIRSPASALAGINLGRGEVEALSLAAEIPDAVLLMDERKGREVARIRGLRVTGTLGVLHVAAQRGWIDHAAVIAKLRQTNFRGPAELF
jgi:predicted nucleic acid-binding protein